MSSDGSQVIRSQSVPSSSIFASPRRPRSLGMTGLRISTFKTASADPNELSDEWIRFVTKQHCKGRRHKHYILTVRKFCSFYLAESCLIQWSSTLSCCHGYPPRLAGINIILWVDVGLGTCPDCVKKCVGRDGRGYSFWLKEFHLLVGLLGRGRILY